MDKTIILDIIDMNDNGQGIAKKNGAVYFVNGAVLGDTVKAKIILSKKNYIVAEAISLVKASSLRKDEFKNMIDIPYGLSLRPLKYKEQLKFKENTVYKTIDKIAGVEIKKKNKIIGLSKENRYRNKGVFPVRSENLDIKIGAFERGSHNIIEETDNISMPETYSIIIYAIKNAMKKFNISAYNELRHKGGLKFITIRSNNDDEHLIILHFNTDELKTKNCEKAFTSELLSALESQNISVIGITKSIKSSKSNSPAGGILSILHGKDYIYNNVGNAKFKLGIESFFQVSSEGVEKLYAEVFRMANLKGFENIWDIYCGVGSIGIYLAKEVSSKNSESQISIKGLEFVSEAINYAKENAKLNNINDTFFECGKAENLLPKWVEKYEKPDIIIVDPPRKGLDKRAIDAIIKTKVDKVIYVSCKASTLARDLKLFNEAGYKVLELTPVDIFPMSMHCEVITILSKQDID